MASRETINDYHEKMIVEFLRGLQRDGDCCAMMLIAMRSTESGVTVEVHCGGSTHDIYRASATLLESVLKPGELGTSRRVGGAEAAKVMKLSDEIMGLAGYDRDDVSDLAFESGLEILKRK